ncbi:MAG: hypothetical protein ACI9U2_000933 [Bradymonadia bacterium]|jgi:hypothetical protein
MRRLLPIICGLVLIGCAEPPSTADLRAVRAELSAIYKTWSADGGLRRPDGYVYTVDLAHALEHAANLGDEGWYDALRPAATKVIIDRRDDPYTAGFVAWREGPGDFPDASGTTEGLHLARALLRGAHAFKRPPERALAMRLVAGYGRHAFVDRGQWLIRNYFNFGTRAFANDSYLVDYDPDFVAEAARITPALSQLAERSASLVTSARTQAGLIHTMMQPDVATVMPDYPLVAFSPNDVVQLNNACWVATSVTQTAPAVAHGMLDFASRRWRRLRRYYYGRSGQPVTNQPADLAARTCIVRLAARLKAYAVMDRLLPDVIPAWRALPNDSVRRIYTLGEILLTLDTVLAAREV